MPCAESVHRVPHHIMRGARGRWLPGPGCCMQLGECAGWDGVSGPLPTQCDSPTNA